MVLNEVESFRALVEQEYSKVISAMDELKNTLVNAANGSSTSISTDTSNIKISKEDLIESFKYKDVDEQTWRNNVLKCIFQWASDMNWNEYHGLSQAFDKTERDIAWSRIVIAYNMLHGFDGRNMYLK